MAELKANELRIGNWIQDTDHFKGYFQVQLIGLDSVHSPDFVLRYNEVSGIELTAEWLERFGFIHEGGSGYKAPHNTEHWYFTLKDWFMPKAMAKGYVHQLQNLYFALTSSELVLQSKR